MAWFKDSLLQIKNRFNDIDDDAIVQIIKRSEDMRTEKYLYPLAGEKIRRL